MSDRVGLRAARKEALRIAAALLETSDNEGIFADLGDGTDEQDGIFDQARSDGAKRILALIGEKS